MLRFWLALGAAASVVVPSIAWLTAAALTLATGCDGGPGTPDGGSIDAAFLPNADAETETSRDLLIANRLWTSSDTSCIYTSPVHVRSQGREGVLVIGVEGEVRLLDTGTGPRSSPPARPIPAARARPAREPYRRPVDPGGVRRPVRRLRLQ